MNGLTWSLGLRAIEKESRPIGDKEYTYCRTGEHTPGGLFVAVGGRIGPDGSAKPVFRILDFCSDFLRGLGGSHDGFEGAAVAEIARPVKIRWRVD